MDLLDGDGFGALGGEAGFRGGGNAGGGGDEAAAEATGDVAVVRGGEEREVHVNRMERHYSGWKKKEFSGGDGTKAA